MMSDSPQPQTLTLSMVIQKAEETLNQAIPIGTVTQILTVFGLENKQGFTPAECELFNTGCILVLKEGLSPEKVPSILSASGLKRVLEIDTTKKSQQISQQMGMEMAILQQQISRQLPYLMQRTLEHWINSGLVCLIANEARSQILAAERTKKPLDKDFSDWCASMPTRLPQLKKQLQQQRHQNRQQ
ncbi:hypothetical protein [Crocosphaera sp. Alani8]|uniref:hypothetical protein n=2 Tax=unclassified Crocosphaera TaxID=2623705 RepID=UPI00313B4F13